MVNDLTFILLMWRKWLAPNNASRQQIGFNSAFKGLNNVNRDRPHMSAQSTGNLNQVYALFY
jgi:hypothetical protein